MLARLTNGSTLSHVRGEMDRLFNDIFAPLAPLRLLEGAAGVFPAVNVWEDDANLYAEAEVPGLKMDDLEVLVMGNELTIKGSRGEPAADENVTLHRRERGFGAFARTMTLPVEIDADKVQANLRDGVLLVTLPKAPSARPRKIEVVKAG